MIIAAYGMDGHIGVEVRPHTAFTDILIYDKRRGVVGDHIRLTEMSDARVDAWQQLADTLAALDAPVPAEVG